MGWQLPPLVAIVDGDVAADAGWNMVDLATACLDGGARLLQIRAKHASSATLLATVAAVVARARPLEAVVVVNDRADIARMGGADGVHVGQDDLPPTAVRTVVGPEAIVGLSTHTPAQLDAAIHQPISYAAIGPVFGTVTKATGYLALGLDAVGRAAERTRPLGLPLVAIGGITLETAPDVLRAGASAVAVIGDLLRTGDPESRVRAYLKHLTV